MLDEGLEVLDGLWTGESYSFEGEHYSVREARFDRPFQRPRVPIWCAGWWPNKRPFRRAARWDGVIPEMVGGDTPEPRHVREIRAYIDEHRGSDAPFDIAIDGYTDEPDPARTEEYEAAGTTWWLERFAPDRLFDFDAAIGRIKAGTHGRVVAGGNQNQKGSR
ncbi:MAG: LLM class flavin-dependent oxidoreductase, partial [Actinobacteria bacterium]|nr:LLM class flavin-dependent oxidoreductase [Actinomycetota bacterium]